MINEDVPEFIQLIDNAGRPYLSFNPDRLQVPIATTNSANVCSFLCDTFQVERRTEQLFSDDLTSIDDFIISALSVLLILAIEAILATLLLRTKNGGYVSNIGFAVKQFVDLVRGFRFKFLIRGPRPPGDLEAYERRVNWKLLFLALIAFVLTFGLEVVILVFSSPGRTHVDNTSASFQIGDEILADWEQVFAKREAAVTLPCTSVALDGVIQMETQLSPCLSTNWPAWREEEVFQKADKEVKLTMVTDVHQFGSDHRFTLDGLEARFFTRSYFTLGDRLGRQMRRRTRSANLALNIAVMHKQYLAHMFSFYRFQTGDKSMNLSHLNKVVDEKLKFEVDGSSEVNIIQISGQNGFLKVFAVRHVTEVTAVMPSGRGPLRFAQAVLKGSTAVSITGGDAFDLMMDSGAIVRNEALMWEEESRSLNWLSLTILLVVNMVIMCALRAAFHPVSTSEIAGAYVSRAVGAVRNRSPGRMGVRELKSFRIGPKAEVQGEYVWASSNASDIGSNLEQLAGSPVDGG